MTRSFIPDLTHVDIPAGAGSTRYRRVEPGFMPYPYKCTGCGSGERACIDLDFQLTDDRIQRGRIGAVLLCTQCFRNCADVMGYIPVELAELNVTAAVDEVMSSDAQRLANELSRISSSMVSEFMDRAGYYADLVSDCIAADLNRNGSTEAEVDLEPEEESGPVEERSILDPGESIESPFTEGTDPETYAREVLGIVPVSYESERKTDKSFDFEGSTRVPTAPKLNPESGF